LRWALFGTLSGLTIGLFSLTSFEANAIKVKELQIDLPEEQAAPTATEMKVAKIEIPRPVSDEPPIEAAEQVIVTVEQEPQGTWDEVTVEAGDSLARIFSKQGIPPRQLHDVIATGDVAKNLTRIHPGQKLRIRTSDEEGLLELVYEIDALTKLRVTRSESGYHPQLIERLPERRARRASAEIQNSLFLAAQRANLPDNITMELAGIFGWDIDFALDIRRGDKFSVLYEDLYLDGERIGTGDLLAAEFVNDDKVYQAVRYTDKQGRTDYYSPDGRSMRKTFLRTPVEFSRISSRFSLGRKHPILNRIRAHKGVDYAAPRGTPVRATGAGKIVLRGKKGGYGKTVVIQHGGRYSTLYAHLNSYARNLKSGNRVQQGQIVGYVGSTGLATGPHLHYEFLVNGVHRNPLTVKLPDAAPLPKQYREDFKLASDNLLAQLSVEDTQTVALQGE
jgi:murein DD-endopeptidase MepM/ murein hydrolase activator NlpD